MPLSKNHVKNVCLMGQDDKTCRYLTHNEENWSECHCVKMSSKKKEIDNELIALTAELKLKGLAPEDSRIPLGDNCKGYPITQHKIQGYDV